MEYIKLTENGPERYTLRQLRKDNPSVSLPESLTLELLSAWAVYPYEKATLPDYNEATQVCEDLGLTQVGSVYSENYAVRDKDQAELDTYADDLASAARADRDDLLASTDWTAGSDVTMTTEMATYRQALRDIPAQDDFPNTVTWPVAP